MTTKLVAVRSTTHTGKAHLKAPHRNSQGVPTRCGRYLIHATATLAWEATAPEDRCTRCAKIALEGITK